MKHHHGFEPGQAGSDHLWPAAETGEEVRLDEPGRDANISLEEIAVQVDRHAGRRSAGGRERRCIAAVVVDDAAGREDVAAKHSLELGISVRAVRTRGDEDRDGRSGDVRYFVEERHQLLATRLGTRNVADGDGDCLAVTNLFS